MSLYTPNNNEPSRDNHADLVRARITELSEAMIVCYANIIGYINHPDTTPDKVLKDLGKDTADLDYLLRLFFRMAKHIHPDVVFRLKYLTPKKKKNASP